MNDLTAIARRAVLDAYEAATANEDIRPEKWIVGALFGWAMFDRQPEPPMHPIRPATSWSEHDARRRVVEATMAAARARTVVLPDEVIVQMLTWIHDIEGWNA